MQRIDGALEGETELVVAVSDLVQSDLQENLQRRCKGGWGLPSRFQPNYVGVQQCIPGRRGEGRLCGLLSRVWVNDGG